VGGLADLLKNPRSFELGTNPWCYIFPTHTSDVLRESPLLGSLHPTGSCEPPDEEPITVVPPSLKNCKLIGNGPLPSVWYIDIPASANLFLSIPSLSGSTTGVCPFRDRCLAPRLQILGGVSTVSIFVGFSTTEPRVQPDAGGVLNVQMY